MTNLAHKYQSISETREKIQKIDRNILKDNVMLTNISEILALTVNLENSKKQITASPEKIAFINQQISTLEAIITQRIMITAEVMNIQQSLLIPTAEDIKLINAVRNTDSDLIDQPIEERMMKSEEEDMSDRKIEPAKKEPKTINATDKFIKKGKEDSKNKQKEEKVIAHTNQVKDTFFKGYTRKAIMNTPEVLTEEIVSLIQDCDTESKVDTIARKLVELGRVEDALNISIDLFETLKEGGKPRAEVEERFLKEILPWAYGITVTPFESYQEITLPLWNKHLLDIVADAALTSELLGKLIEEAKVGEISLELANTINTSSINIGSHNLYLKACEILGIKELNFAPATFGPKPAVSQEQVEITRSEESIENTEVIGMTLETLTNECAAMYNGASKNPKAFKKARAHFYANLKLVTDVTDEEKKNAALLWGNAVIVLENVKENTEITPETKEEIVAKAEEAAVNGKDEIISENGPKKASPEFVTKAREIIIDAFKHSRSALNELRAFWSTDKKAIGDEKITDIYNKIKEELTEKGETKVFRPITEPVDLATKYPKILEGANLCNNITELAELIVDVIYNQKEEIKDGFRVAYSATLARINQLEGHEAWETPVIDTWFRDVVKAETDRRRKVKEEDKKEEFIKDAVIVEEVKNTEVATEITETTKVEASDDITSKFSHIATESKASRVKDEAVKAILAGVPEETIMDWMKENPIWKKDKNKVQVVTNILNKLKVIVAEQQTK